MKVKELIKELQQYDSEMEVCVDNIDIHFLGIEPSYWDGWSQRLIRDNTTEQGYDIIGAEYIPEDETVVNISLLSITSAIWNDPKIPVKCYSEEQEQVIIGIREEASDAYEKKRKKGNRI